MMCNRCTKSIFLILLDRPGVRSVPTRKKSDFSDRCFEDGGTDEIRTRHPLVANEVLCQMSYSPGALLNYHYRDRFTRLFFFSWKKSCYFGFQNVTPCILFTYSERIRPQIFTWKFLLRRASPLLFSGRDSRRRPSRSRIRQSGFDTEFPSFFLPFRVLPFCQSYKARILFISRSSSFELQYPRVH